MASETSLNRGFTLVELVAVLLIVGIVAAVAISRWDAGRGVDEAGYSQRVLITLRIAQRRARADRCDVRVSITPATIQVLQRAALCSGAFNRSVGGTAGAGSDLGGPPPVGVALSAAPGVFYFDAGGRVLASPGGAVTNVTIDIGTRQILLTGATGYASL